MFKTLKYLIFFLFVITDFLGNSQNQKIYKISITGNTKTKERVINRATGISLNDTIPKKELAVKLKEAKVNLINTSLFNSVQVSELSTGNLTEVIIMVEERWYFWPYLILENAETNFNTWWQTKKLNRLNYGLNLNKENTRGANEYLIFVVQLGYSKQIGLGYKIPFFNEKTNFGGEFWTLYKQRREIVYGTENNKRQFLTEPNNGKLRQEFFSKFILTYSENYNRKHSVETRYQHAFLGDTILDINPNYFGNNKNFINYIAISYNYRIDKRNNRAYPLKGYFLDFGLHQKGLGLLYKENSATYSIIQLRKYGEIKPRLNYGVSIKSRINLKNDIPYYFQQALGYDDFVRGFEYYVIDGEHYGLLKSSLKYTLVKPKIKKLKWPKDFRFNNFQYALYLNSYVDAGYVQNNYSGSFNNYSNKLISGYGIGLDLVTYYDKIVRFEYSFNNFGENGFYLHFRQPI